MRERERAQARFCRRRSLCNTMWRICHVRMPRRVISEMVSAGCLREKVPGEALIYLRTEVGSAAWAIFVDWASTLGEVDPPILPFWSPSAQIVGTALAPALALVGPILTEVASIMSHCAPMNMAAFTMGPPIIPGPLCKPPLPVPIHHANVAVTGVMQQIQNPPPNYPTLANLGAGSYICHLDYRWTGASVVAAVFKS